jgi:hypothetical protein
MVEAGPIALGLKWRITLAEVHCGTGMAYLLSAYEGLQSQAAISSV